MLVMARLGKMLGFMLMFKKKKIGREMYQEQLSWSSSRGYQTHEPYRESGQAQTISRSGTVLVLDVGSREQRLYV